MLTGQEEKLMDLLGSFDPINSENKTDDYPDWSRPFVNQSSNDLEESGNSVDLLGSFNQSDTSNLQDSRQSTSFHFELELDNGVSEYHSEEENFNDKADDSQDCFSSIQPNNNNLNPFNDFIASNDKDEESQEEDYFQQIDSSGPSLEVLQEVDEDILEQSFSTYQSDRDSLEPDAPSEQHSNVLEHMNNGGGFDNQFVNGFNDDFARESADVFTIQDDGQLVAAEMEEQYSPPASTTAIINNFTQHERSTSSEKSTTESPFGGAEGRCQVCNDRVYHVEKITTDKHIFHKRCFRCSKCKTALAVGNYNLHKDNLYCYNHYIDLTRMRDLNAESNEDRNVDVVKDVVKSGDASLEDDLPRDVTQNALARFKELESSKPSSYQPMYKPRNVSNSRQPACDSVQLSYSITSSRSKSRDPPPADVVRESDNNDVLPESGTTQNMLAMWKNIQSVPVQNVPLNNGQNGPRKRFVPPPPTDDNLCFPTSYRPTQSQKQVRRPDPPADVVRSDEPPPDELPAPEMAKSLAARFKALERQGPAPTPEISSRLQKSARAQSGVNANIRLPNQTQLKSSNYSDSDYPEWDPQTRQGVDQSAENEPEIRDDYIRGDYSNPKEEFPESGITRNLLERFQSMGNQS